MQGRYLQMEVAYHHFIGAAPVILSRVRKRFSHKEKGDRWAAAFLVTVNRSYATCWGTQYASNARASSCAIAGAVEPSIAERCIR